MAFRENLIGIGYLIACTILFLINDVVVKLANAYLPLGELVAVRAVIASTVMFLIVLATGAYRSLPLLWHRGVAIRALAEAGASFFYLVALFHMPIANANTILQIVPLLITASAALFLGEAVGWRRWTAIAVGFLGVLIVVRPGFADFNAFSLFALASAGFSTLRDLATRQMPAGIPALAVSLATGVVVGVFAPVYAVVAQETWVMPSAEVVGLIAIGVGFLIGAYITSIAFMRHGDISIIAPFRYLAIVFAIILGFIVWREIPDLPMIVGMAVIAAAGIYTFRRERNQARLAMEVTDPV
jgi:drug/metabolite transporter (DMT)-like permease